MFPSALLQDLVKSHLMYAVREEVEVLKEQIKELYERNSVLERENAVLKSLANSEQLSQLSTQSTSSSGAVASQPGLSQPQQQAQPPLQVQPPSQSHPQLQHHPQPQQLQTQPQLDPSQQLQPNVTSAWKRIKNQQKKSRTASSLQLITISVCELLSHQLDHKEYSASVRVWVCVCVRVRKQDCELVLECVRVCICTVGLSSVNAIIKSATDGLRQSVQSRVGEGWGFFVLSFWFFCFFHFGCIPRLVNSWACREDVFSWTGPEPNQPVTWPETSSCCCGKRGVCRTDGEWLSKRERLFF